MCCARKPSLSAHASVPESQATAAYWAVARILALLMPETIIERGPESRWVAEREAYEVFRGPDYRECQPACYLVSSVRQTMIRLDDARTVTIC